MDDYYPHAISVVGVDLDTSTTHSLHSATQVSIFTSYPSPSSLALSDISSEVSALTRPLRQDEMDDTMRAGPGDDMRGAMTQVLYQMERINQHLRSKGEKAAANNMAKNIVAFITSLTEATAKWEEDDDWIMQPVARSVPPSDTASAIAASASVSTITSPPESARFSWAKVAAAAPGVTNSLVRSIPSETVQATRVDPSDMADPAHRVVWIRGWTEHRRLSEITKKIGQGALYSMAYSAKDEAVCIIFQRAASAKALCEEEEKNIKTKGVGKFGTCDLVLGQPFSETDDIRRMNPPYNERRRLTFARQQLFTNGLTEQKFTDDIYAIVGEVNVELVWLFNTGNATAILSAVPLARLVRDEFLKYAKHSSSPYFEVDVSFSQDPCEKPLNLTTQITAGNDIRRAGTYGGAISASTGSTAKAGLPGRRSGRGSDIDGWQTVGKRRDARHP